MASARILLLWIALAGLLPLVRCQSAIANSTAFTRTGAYTYQECASQPGEVPAADGSGVSRCIAIDPGSLTFCSGVSYIACLRKPVPADYDKLVSDAYTLRSTRLALEFPNLAQATCLTAFQSYFCALSFPQCVSVDGVYVELPVCWSYCLQAEQACGSADLATKTCLKGVAAGRVAPDRPDVQCMSCARHFQRVALLVVVFASLATSLGA